VKRANCLGDKFLEMQFGGFLMKQDKKISWLRPSVVKFATEMEKILQEYDAIKGSDGWQNESIEWLFERLVQGVFKLYGAIFLESQPAPTSIKEECCDVANFAMMIFDHFEGCSNKEKTTSTVKTKEMKEALCPKCHSRKVITQWHLTCHPTMEGPHCECSDYNRMDREHLHYYCRNCGYDWSIEIKHTTEEEKEDNYK